MSIIDRSQQLIQRISTDTNGFATPVVFVAPDNSYTKTVPALATKHMLKVDENGFKSIGQTMTLAVSEKALNDAGYPTRNEYNEVNLLQHRVTWTDVSGIEWTYTVRQTRPDDRIGLITLILDDYEMPITPARIIIGWKACAIHVVIVDVPNPDNTQTLDNGDVIPVEYALNNDGTLTIPYLVSVPGITVLTPFMLFNNEDQNMPYSNGTFDNSANGGFFVGNEIAFNASLPIWSV